MNAGQACVAGSRILVQRPIYEAFLDAFAKVAAGWTPGDPFDRIDAPRSARAQTPIRSRDGLSGHREAKKAASCSAAVVRPDSIRATTWRRPRSSTSANSARVCQEEIFGPVAVMMPFDDADDALQDRQRFDPMGWPGYIWTESQTHRALRQPSVADRNDLDQCRL